MFGLKTKFIPQIIDYDGSQISSHWIFKNFNLIGDVLISFRGKCEVNFEKMLDLINLKKKSPISSEDMLHFLGEFFERDLVKGIFLQRLLIITMKETLEKLKKGIFIQREGNDLYFKKKKLTISIATLSPISILIHAGINIKSKNTPIPTLGLEDLELEYKSFSEEVLKKFKEELESIYRDRSKVRPVE